MTTRRIHSRILPSIRTNLLESTIYEWLSRMPSQTEPAAAVASPGQAFGKPNGAAVSASAPSELDIIDIRRETVESNIKEEIMSMFHPRSGPRMLPTLLLYSKRGLQLFEDVSISSSTPALACSELTATRSPTWKNTTSLATKFRS